MIQTFRIKKQSIWKPSFYIEDINGNQLIRLNYKNSMMSEAKIESPQKNFFIERTAMGAEISVYDGNTDEEIALLESEISMSGMKYNMRFRYKEDKFTFVRKSTWTNSEFEWRNEAWQELVRIRQKWHFLSVETLVEVNTELVKGEDFVLLPALAGVLMYYFKASHST